MFVDYNGDLFHLAVRKPDKAFIIGKMRDDYLMPSDEYKICQGIEYHAEAPAIIKVNNVYHMVSSGSSGWKPSKPIQGRYIWLPIMFKEGEISIS
jgi:hypothetical protein